jgi:predicted transcriptional regulator
MNIGNLEARISALEAEVADIKQRLDHAEAVAGIQRGLDEVNRGLARPAAEVVERIRKGLAAADAGHVRPAREALEALRLKHNIPLQGPAPS